MAIYMEKSDAQKSRAYSPGVITQGGKIVWLAGQTALRDESGADISGNFEAQVRTIFSLLDKTLKKAGGSLANMVTMTVFIAAPGTETLPVRMFLYIQDNIDPLVTSVSACVIAVTVLALVVLDRAYGLERLLVGRSADGR
jgi:enamine deaminase RidA (YjgF/YER057c/UK114 family)